ncbi:MAG: autotransporter outer membrane beta-barrel domain-containing protein [Pseudomonadales bacterium]|nr:autotransporter outer membrane beta-barrel domain-containing protein [Pseudomonadales bacterium]
MNNISRPFSHRCRFKFIPLISALFILPNLAYSAPGSVGLSVTINETPDRALGDNSSISTSNISPAEAAGAALSALCPTLVDRENTLAQDNLLQLCSALNGISIEEQSQIFDQLSSKANAANANISNLQQSGFQQQSTLSSSSSSQSDKSRKAAYSYRSQIPIYAFLGSSSNTDWDYFYKRINTFTSFDGSFSERDETVDDAGFESIHLKFLFGADYRINNTFLVGTAITLGRSETELAMNRGTADSTAVNWTLFSFHQIRDYWSINATLMFQNTDYKNSRKINITLPPMVGNYSLSAESSAKQTGLLLGSDYQWQLPRAFEISLLNQINAVRTETDSFRESGNTGFELSIDAQEVNNTAMNNGIELRKPMNQTWGVVIPQISIHWTHQFADQSREIKAAFIHDPQANLIAYSTKDSDSDYFTTQLGAVFVVPNGINAFAQLSSILGFEHYDNTSLSIGLRGEF